MSASMIVIEGTVTPEGTLELDQKVSLPAGGRVQVIVQPLPELPDTPFWRMMQEIWANQKARGHVPRSVEEVEAERRAIREESEGEIQEAMRLQEESRRLRQEAEQKKGQTS